MYKRLNIGFAFLIISISTLKAQVYNQKIKNYIDQVDSIVLLLDQFENLGTKISGTQELENTRKWLLSKYNLMGYSDIFLDSFKVGSTLNQNIIIDKISNIENAPTLIICSHYDTKNGPGVNDNGTGVSATLEIARIIEPLACSVNVRFIHFAGEEPGLLGSYHYVNNVLDIKDSIFLVLNIDQLGGTIGRTDNFKIYCEKDESNSPSSNNHSSAKYTSKMANVFKLYTSVEPKFGEVSRSDYVPFEKKNYTVTGLYQYSNGAPFNHSINDSLCNIDTLSTIEISKGALAFVLEVANSKETASLKIYKKPIVKISPNPSHGEFIVKGVNMDNNIFTLYNSIGQEVPLEVRSNNLIKLKVKEQGYYILKIKNNRDNIIYRVKILLIP